MKDRKLQKILKPGDQIFYEPDNNKIMEVVEFIEKDGKSFVVLANPEHLKLRLDVGPGIDRSTIPCIDIPLKEALKYIRVVKK